MQTSPVIEALCGLPGSIRDMLVVYVFSRTPECLAVAHTLQAVSARCLWGPPFSTTPQARSICSRLSSCLFPVASWYVSSGQGSVVHMPDLPAHPVPTAQVLMSPPSTFHPLLPALGGYKVSRRAARWAEGSTQLCMASAMLRMWSPRHRLPAESGGGRRGCQNGPWAMDCPASRAS